MMFLFYSQGFNFFSSGLRYQYVKNGIDRNGLNLADTIKDLLCIFGVYVVGSYANRWGYTKGLAISRSIHLLFLLYIWIWFPSTLAPVFILTILIGLAERWNFLLHIELAADFPEMGVTGMLFTLSISGLNFGSLDFLHTWLLDHISWRTSALIGLIMQFFLNLMIPWLMMKINEGKTLFESVEEQQNQIEIV